MSRWLPLSCPRPPRAQDVSRPYMTVGTFRGAVGSVAQFLLAACIAAAPLAALGAWWRRRQQTRQARSYVQVLPMTQDGANGPAASGAPRSRIGVP